MSVSTDALLIYGYELDYSDGDPELGEKLEARLLAELAGFTETHKDGKEGFFARQREALGSIPVEIVLHCSVEYPMYILALRMPQHEALRGEPIRLGESLPIIPNKLRDELSTAKSKLERVGVEFNRSEPSWILCSMTG